MWCLFRRFFQVKKVPVVPVKPPEPPAITPATPPRHVYKAFYYTIVAYIQNPNGSHQEVTWSSDAHLDFRAAQNESRDRIKKINDDLNKSEDMFFFIIDAAFRRDQIIRVDAKDVVQKTWVNGERCNSNTVFHPEVGKNVIIVNEEGSPYDCHSN